MKCSVERASEWWMSDNPREDVEINTMADLLDFIKKNGDIIVQKPDPGYDLRIIIYDDYIE